MPEYWLQLENHWWDVSPNNIDRTAGLQIQAIPGNAPPVVKTLTSPVTGVTTNHTMCKPLPEEALIIRRYTAGWAAPDDRKLNPWDLNEPDPPTAEPWAPSQGPQSSAGSVSQSPSTSRTWTCARSQSRGGPTACTPTMPTLTPPPICRSDPEQFHQLPG